MTARPQPRRSRRSGFQPGAERLEERSLLSVVDGFLDLVFVSEKYSDFNRFQRDVTRCMQELFQFEPFRSRQSQIRVHTIENTQSLGSRLQGDRLLLVDNNTVEQIVQASGNPADVSVVLVDQSQYGGSGGQVTVAYNGSAMPRMFVHELGHTLAGLMDEYILIPGPGPVANQPHANVYAGAVPPAAAWANLVGATDYALGGHYQNWWRASPSSVMLNLDTGYFNSVSQVLLNQAIDTYAGKWVDPSKPIAKIASPADGSVVSGMVTITPRVGDNRGIAWVQLWKDGVLWSTAYTAPYPLTWNATREAEGLHTLQVRAVDAAGNVGVSETHLVYIDTTRPTVSITSPTHNANVQGIVNVGVNATDRSGISHVTLSVDGVVIATTTTAPYVLPWDARSTSGNARKTLVVTAYDRAGLKNSTQVVVTARGVRDVIAPTVRILAPTPRRAVSVSDVMTVQVNARDNVGIKALWVRLDGRVVAHDEQAPFGTYQVALSPFAKRRGLRTLQVVVQDLAGNMGRSQPVPIRLV